MGSSDTVVVPRLSVVMPVKNAAPHVDEAVASILGQTFSDFEFVIRDDGSDDDSLARLRRWAERDPRIRLFAGEASLGPAGSSNWVVQQARAPIIARMDADDISAPDRLEVQLRALEAAPDVVLVGSVARVIDEAGKPLLGEAGAGASTASFSAPFAHGSIMFRRDAFDRVSGYRSACDFWEDFDLFIRLSDHGRMLVSTSPLYSYRHTVLSTRITSPRAKVENAIDLMLRCRERFRSGRSYEQLLAGDAARQRDKLHPETFSLIGYMKLLSGARPAELRSLLRRGRLKLDLATARSLSFLGWAAIEPRSLKRLVFILKRWKVRRTRHRLRDRPFLEWSPRGS